MRAGRARRRIEPSTASTRTILKSTSLVGMASLGIMATGIIRMKLLALFAGPAGLALAGVYAQAVALVGGVTGLGIGSSGVRQIADAVGSGDGRRIAAMMRTVRRASWVTGVVGTAVMLALCVPISRFSFGSDRHAAAMGLLATTILLSAIAAGQACILRGTRRIRELSLSAIIASVLSLAAGAPLVIRWGAGGIVPGMVLGSLVSLLVSWWFVRRVPVRPIRWTWRQSVRHSRGLVTLGATFMAATLAATATGYVIQALLVRRFGLPGAGMYQAAYGLTGRLVAFVLGAMSADYFPRLTAVARDRAGVRALVNDQSQVSLLLALPGLAALMAFAPWLIRAFYTGSFLAATDLLRWCAIGILGQVLTWPLGMVLVAQGRGALFLATEVAAGGIHLGAVALLTRVRGLEGAGMAFVALYAVYGVAMLAVLDRLVGFPWNARTTRLAVGAVAVLALLKAGSASAPASPWALAAQACAVGVVTAGCARQLARVTGLTWEQCRNALRIRLGGLPAPDGVVTRG